MHLRKLNFVLAGIITILVFTVALKLSRIDKTAALGQSLIVALLMVPITYYVTQYIFEHRKSKRWDALKTRIMHELNRQFTGIFTELSSFCGFSSAMAMPLDASDEESDRLMDEQLLRQLKEAVDNQDIRIRDERRQHIIEGQMGPLFKNRSIYLNDFQIKFLDYLGADIILCIMNIQNALHDIDQDIAIRVKQVRNNWTRWESDEQILKRIEMYFQTIADNLQTLREQGAFIYHGSN